MQQTFTKQFMEDNRGCYEHEELYKCSFMQAKRDITLKSIIDSEISLKDKYWFICKKLATKEQNQQIAIDVAEMVLPIFENRYPNDKRPREVIEAVRQFIAGHISINALLEKRRAAAYAAYAAAYAAAAYADAAAAYAAYAAYAAAYAAAAYAAYADAYAAYAVQIKQQLQDYLNKFIEQ